MIRLTLHTWSQSFFSILKSLIQLSILFPGSQFAAFLPNSFFPPRVPLYNAFCPSRLWPPNGRRPPCIPPLSSLPVHRAVPTSPPLFNKNSTLPPIPALVKVSDVSSPTSPREHQRPFFLSPKGPLQNGFAKIEPTQNGLPHRWPLGQHMAQLKERPLQNGLLTVERNVLSGGVSARSPAQNGTFSSARSPVLESFSPKSERDPDDVEGEFSSTPPSSPSLTPSPSQRDSESPVGRKRRHSSSSTDSCTEDIKPSKRKPFAFCLILVSAFYCC